MTLTCADTTERYIQHLGAEFRCLTSGSRIHVITPYLYRDNDRIDVFVEEPSPGLVRVTDLGETIRHLQAQGFDMSASSRRRETAETIADGLGVGLIRGELIREGGVNEVGELLLDVIGAAKGVSDLIYTSRAYEPATFLEEVDGFLRDSHVQHEQQHKLKGESGKIYTVSFRLPKGDRSMYLHALSPGYRGGMKRTVDSTVRMWLDCNGTLGRESKFSLLNDVGHLWRRPEVMILERLSIVGRWSRRQGLVPLLSQNGHCQTDHT